MNDYLFILPIVIAAIIGVISPGPSFIFVAQTTLNKSRQYGIAASFGLGTGAGIFALLACFGLFVVLEASPLLYTALKIAGGLYLLYLAYKIWHSTQQNRTVDNTQESPAAPEPSTATKIARFGSIKSPYIKYYFMGLFTQLSNPKTAIVIGSFIMAFLPHDVPPYSFLIITLLIAIIDCSWYCIVSGLLSTAAAQRLYARYETQINQLASTIMALLGLKLALSL